MKLNADLSKKHKRWDRISGMVENDEERFTSEPYMIGLPNESPAALEERKKYFGTGFINITEELITAPGDVAFKNGARFATKNTSSMMAGFMDSCLYTKVPVPFKDFVRDTFMPQLRAYGTTFAVIDKPQGVPINRAQERAEGMPYISMLDPLDVINYAYKDGDLAWFVYKSTYGADWLNPMDEEPESRPVECIWTKEQFIMREVDGAIIPAMSFDHKFGIVPVVIQSSFLARPDDTIGNSTFEQTSNMLIMFNNLLHICNYELFKHGNSLLLMNDENISPANMETDRQGNTKMKKQSQGSIFIYSGEKEPHYLVKELAVKEAFDQAKYYLTLAIENERDLKSLSAKGVTGEMVAESGFAKMIDREPIEANLRALVGDTETWAKQVTDIVAMELAVQNDAIIEFNKTFDVRTANQAFADIKAAADVRLNKYSPTASKVMYKSAATKITANDEELKIINNEIEENAQAVADEEASEAKLKAELVNGFNERQPGDAAGAGAAD
jgi:hypothetical protein